MDIHARLTLARIAPRKMRLVARTLPGLKASDAEVRLQYLAPRGSQMLLKLLKSAIANAKHNFEIDPKKLVVKEVRVGGGAKLKRFMPRSRGSAYRIEKKTSHVDLVLTDQEEAKKVGKKSEIITRKVEELTSDELSQKGTEKNVEEEKNTGSVKKTSGQVKTEKQVFNRRGGEG